MFFNFFILNEVKDPSLEGKRDLVVRRFFVASLLRIGKNVL